AARYPGMVPALDAELHFLGQHVSRLGDTPVPGKHLPGEYQRLGAGPGFRQAAGDQQLVGTNLAHAALWMVQPAIRSRCRPSSAPVGSSFSPEKAGSGSEPRIERQK